MKIKLLQWNILYKEKIENILKTIEKINPDIICLQELTRGGKWNDYKDTAKWLSKKLNYFYYSTMDHRFKEGNQGGNGIFSRFPIKGKTSARIVEPHGKLKYEGHKYIEVSLSINGKLIKIGTTHFLFEPYFLTTPEKKKEFLNLFRIIKKENKRFIFAGDLNTRSNSYIIKELKKKFKSCGPNLKLPTWTTKPFDFKGFKEKKLRWRIDYVFTTKDIRVLKSEIIKTKYSDHLPIYIEFEI